MTEYRKLIDVKDLKNRIEEPMIHYFVKDEYQSKFRHLFSIPAIEENLKRCYEIVLGLTNEFDQVAYMDESDMTFEHFTDHDCDRCHCGWSHMKVGSRWLCYDCIEAEKSDDN